MKYRPWGSLTWALSLARQHRWSFVGLIGTEERSLCSWKYAKALNLLGNELFAEVLDVDNEKYRSRTEQSLNTRRTEFINAGGDFSTVYRFDLMAELFIILDFAERAEKCGSAVIFDVTSFPKRFFFPILRALVRSKEIENLLITYTIPASYATDAPLYEDIEPWRVLAGFGGATSRHDHWVISVGFLVESLRQYVSSSPNEKMNLLIPFPAPLSALRRTWESIADLEREYSSGRFEKHRVDTLDISDAFDRICSIAGNPPTPLAFAPFGPKPISIAMCLYASQFDSSVHYPQPTVYHPDYSCGIRGGDPATSTLAYWIKHDAEDLYIA